MVSSKVNGYILLFDPQLEPSSVLSIWVRVDLRVMVKKMVMVTNNYCHCLSLNPNLGLLSNVQENSIGPVYLFKKLFIFDRSVPKKNYSYLIDPCIKKLFIFDSVIF